MKQALAGLAALPHGADRRRAAALTGVAENDILDFSSNINPYGLTGEIRAAAAAAADWSNAYPDPHGERFVEELAVASGLLPSQIVPGNGGADLIFRLAAALRFLPDFAKRPALLVLDPCFSEYAAAFAAYGFRLIHYPLRAENAYSLTPAFLSYLDVLKSKIAVIFLAQPNNPTGLTIDPELLQAIRARCHQYGITLLLDECFLDFLDETEQIRKRLRQDGLYSPWECSLHSLTKLYAIPGLRLGWLEGAADSPLLARVRALTPPWMLSAPAIAAGRAALRTAPLTLARWREDLERERRGLLNVLAELGATGITGEVNFLFFRHPAGDLAERLLHFPERPVLIRPCANYPGLDEHCYRIAVKAPEENDCLLRALRWAAGAN